VDISINLSDLPTALHRAGLAGLYITLSHLRQFNGELIQWNLTQDSVNLQGNCSDKEAIEWLLNHTYQIDLQNLIKIPVLPELTFEEQVNFHQGMTGTLIFHPLVVKSKGVTDISLEIDEKVLELKYKALEYYPHQDLKSVKAFERNGNFKPSIKIAGWLYPGGSELHVALSGKTKLEEPPQGLIALAFAPIVCSYYKIRSRLKQNKHLWALAIPEVEDLEAFAQAKKETGSQEVHFDHYYASGLSDASLRDLNRLAGDKVTRSLPIKACEVWAFGSRPWSKQQVITDKQRVEIDPSLRKLYQLCNSHLKGGIKVGKKGTFISVSFGREIATENMVQGQHWYANLHRVLSLSTDYFDALRYEARLLQAMKEATIENDYISPDATKFCDGISWIHKELYLQVYINSSGQPNYNRVRQELQMSIRSVKTQEQFVRWLTELTSRPANRSNPFWQDLDLGEFYHWARANWEECLSLAALAVLTYKNPWKVERTRNLLIQKGWKPRSQEELKFIEKGEIEAEIQEPEEGTNKQSEEIGHNRLAEISTDI
jgi:CRISPR-associated protein Cas8a1/Csx13